MDADLSKTVCIVGRQGEDAMKKWCRIFLLSLLLCIAMCAGAQAAEHDMLKVGLKYGSTAMDEANLQNYSPFGGYALGYYDSSRSFVQLTVLPASYEKITVTQDKTYHVQLSETFYDYASASARAAQYGGFAAYDNGAFVARVGNYSDYGSAQSALYSLGTGGTVVGGSSTGVTVIVTGTSTILFEFDQSGLYSLGIRPAEAGQKTVTWFRGYRYYGGFEYQRVTGGAISNSTSIAGLMKLSDEEVLFNDGLFELLLVPVPRTSAAMQALILALVNKDYYNSEGLIFRHVKHVTAETAEDIPWTLDGEYDPGAPFVEIGIEESGLTMMI